MDILTFLEKGYTAFHVTQNVAQYLVEKGFCPLEMGQKWQLRQGKGYFVTQNDSALVAFKTGENKIFNVCESHTDSPCLKIKGNGTVSGVIPRLDAERYGGGIMYSFMDRKLKIAGRLLVQKDGKVQSKLTVSDFNVVIPSLAIHHNPNVNDNFTVNVQTDMLPLFSQGKSLYERLTQEKVLDSDLYAVPAEKPFYAGAEKEYLCGARIDNLTSVYACMQAIADCVPQNVAVAAFLDNEEVGSSTRQGSPLFLQRVLNRIEHALGMTDEQREEARQKGMVLSVDNGHATHPAHPEKSDATFPVTLNGGVVIKHHPNYATDGLTSALLKNLLQGKVPVQDYYNRSDVRCGSTLGLVTSRTLQMKTCDVGAAQLAMHSACETMGAKDVGYVTQALTEFLNASLE